MARSVTSKPSAPSTPAAIPHTVSDHVCLDFVNSRFTDHTGGGRVHDRIGMDEWCRWYAARCGITVERPPSAEIRRRLVELRDLLRGLLELHKRPDADALAALNLVLAPAPLIWQLSPATPATRLSLAWRRPDWTAVMAATATSYAQLLVSGGIDRIKVCANPDCSFMFYDETRNRSRRWCEASACGNLVRVRRHRAQRRR